MIARKHQFDVLRIACQNEGDGDLDIFASAWNIGSSEDAVDRYVVLHLENNLAQTRIPSENQWSAHVLGNYSNALHILVDDIDGRWPWLSSP